MKNKYFLFLGVLPVSLICLMLIVYYIQHTNILHIDTRHPIDTSGFISNPGQIDTTDLYEFNKVKQYNNSFNNG